MVSSGNKLRLLMDLLLVALVPLKCTAIKLYLFLYKLLIKSSINQSIKPPLSGNGLVSNTIKHMGNVFPLLVAQIYLLLTD